ncbi:glomulin, FKBP associated protein a [Electrophorus electricus]|uniref:Glomulin, FKBP associated protein a n=2 Tax=Electrophorus TaxID=8004 RepID=A0A4W4FHL1_ELEEL|nr:glomulin, FKBP associated protein a [Electrophorus electricus]XP_026887572.1 glomulin, FKBP associated protein a [Electrophorus electricus]XP_026887580.1 glomulin, FKBP associated protein a [Electrophorus electricus]
MALEQFSDVVQRCQAIQDGNFSSADFDLFQTVGQTCIEQGDSAQVLSIVIDEKNKNIVRCMGWNLLEPLVKVLLKKEDKNLPHCHAILTHLLEVCSPKELLVGLLEQIEQLDSGVIAETIILLLKPLQTVLLKLGRKKASSVGMALSTLLSQMVRLPVPLSKEQEEDDVFGLCRCCVELLGFVSPFVEEIKADARDSHGMSRENELRVEILKFCMKSLCEPLLEVQLKDADTLEKSPLRDFATGILVILNSIGESLPNLLGHSILRKREVPGFLEEEVRYPKESLASMAHLLFVQHIAMDIFPAVLSPVFVMQCNMEYIEVLLSSTEESRLQKGLELYEKTLVRLENSSLPVDLLDLKTFFSVPQHVIKVMTLSPVQNLRTKGLSVFQLSIDKLNTEAKYKFFRCMLKTSGHAGVEGYIIKNIKNQTDFALKPGNGNEWFLGKHLLPLLQQVLCLPQGPETDLLHNLDRIMESLNLLRYLLIRDKEWENETGIWTELYKIEDNYLKPLRTALNMSRAHYEAELKRNKENTTGSKSPVCTVSLGSEKIPHMTPEMQTQVLQSALFTFDLIESVLARIEEIAEAKGRL